LRGRALPSFHVTGPSHGCTICQGQSTTACFPCGTNLCFRSNATHVQSLFIPLTRPHHDLLLCTAAREVQKVRNFSFFANSEVKNTHIASNAASSIMQTSFPMPLHRHILHASRYFALPCLRSTLRRVNPTVAWSAHRIDPLMKMEEPFSTQHPHGRLVNYYSQALPWLPLCPDIQLWLRGAMRAVTSWEVRPH
jgi:hypothetical protein